ncbi:MAG TPA: nucleotidyl transferase AbiEii/AbiGii toxin family protein [Gemmataceae bacterium]|nr:nucleotidyl transferase AbiEii/AbiGii toxin family protein [Gemmataceae bacterium]
MSQPAPRLIDRHVRALRVSTELSAYSIEKIVTPLQVIAVLNRERISFVLVGAYAVGGWTRKPRATEDVDLVVAERQIKKATRALLAEFPQLEARDEEVVVRLQDRASGEVLIDLIKPRSIYRAIFKHTEPISQGGQEYRIPSLEMTLATKFAAMVSPNRPDDAKHQDATDFIRMVKENPDIDLDTLTSLGELVYGGGGAGACEMVRQVRAGEKLIL